MTAQFAGSRSLDDRRRRRLAKESSDEIAHRPTHSPVVNQEDSANVDSGLLTTLRSDVVAAESIIPSALWKVLVYAFAGMTMWGLLIWVNLKEVDFDGVERLLSPAYGNAFRLFSVLSLFLTSQLSFMIWWYRSRSRKDFGGRYRIWAWAGCFWGCVCLSTGLSLHEPLAQLAYEHRPIHSWRPELLYWFVPFSIGLLALHQLISLDMRHARLSRYLWNSTLICGVLAAGLKFGLNLYLPQSHRDLAVVGSASLWHFSISLTLLFHARFVVHVTNEAAPREDVWYLRVRAWLLDQTSGVRSRIAPLFTQRRALREEKRTARALARKEKREQQAAQKAEKAELRKRQIADSKCAREEKLKANQLAKQEIAEQKKLQAAEKKELAEKRRQQALAEKTIRQKSPHIETNPEENAEEGASQQKTIEPKTVSGKKRKRVLGTSSRVDAPQAVAPPHVNPEPVPPHLPQYTDSVDYNEEDLEDDDQESHGGYASKKDRRRARKNRR